MRNNHAPSRQKIATLKATAAAVFALSAGGALATSCPIYIDPLSSIPGVCNFDSTNSVTVGNGGSVGGILMNSYLPNSPSFIQVNSGGQINAAGIGIRIIDHSSLSDGITNAGMITATSTGIVVSQSIVSGGISNSGTITANQTGLKVTNSLISGGIINSGMITAVSAGIDVRGSTVFGGISNTGTITSTNLFGIYIKDSAVVGDIINNGTITAHKTGLYVTGSTVSGSVINNGTITSSNGTGLNVSHSTVSGSVINSGTINALTDTGLAVTGSIVTGGIANTGIINASDAGIVVNSSTIFGGISNSGTINSVDLYGIYIKSSSNIVGNVDNSGTITANKTGLFVSSSDVHGSVINSGTITADNGFGMYIFSNSTVSGGIINSGVINSHKTGLYVMSNSTVGGGILNSGTITSFDTGLNVSHSTVSGGVTNTGTITSTNDTGFAFTSSIISGGITNSGTINAQDDGLIASHSTVSGGITNSGTINANTGLGFAVILSTINGNINNTGTINGDTGVGFGIGGSTINGNISNSGTINVDNGVGFAIEGSTINGNISNSGRIIANNGIGFGVSTASITGGITNSGTITSTSGTGLYVVNTTTVIDTITNSGTIQGMTNAIVFGAGTVTNLDISGGSARIIGNVDAATTNVTLTSGSIFSTQGVFNVSNFTVGNGALLSMNNQINVGAGAGLFHNQGTLSIKSGSSQTITGNYTQEAMGVFQLGAKNISDYGQLGVTGTANLLSDANIYVQIQADSSFHQGDVLSNVLTAGTLTPPGGYSVSDNSAIWKITGSTNGNNVNLTFDINPNAYSACNGSYCAQAASVIVGQVASGNVNFSPFATLPTELALCNAASQSTPELLNENFQVTQLVTRSVLDILPMWSNYRGQSAGDAMLYQPGKVWLKPYGSGITQHQRNTVDGYHATAYGLVGGIDKQVSDDWMVGGALAIGNDKVRGNAVLSGQTINSDDYQGILYATKTLPNHMYLAGQALVGYGNNDTKRAMPLFGSTASGSYGSWFTNLSTELGKSYAVNQRLMLTPTVNVSYLYINQNGYTEHGSIMDLNIHSNNNSTLLLGADANAAYHLGTFHNNQDATLTAHVGVAGNVLNNQASTISTFVAGGPTFSTYGIFYNDAVFRGGAGLTLANPTSPLLIELNYDAQTGNNGYNQIGSATIKYKM